MTNKIYIPKAHLIMGLCLPLAVLLGYLLADPTELSSIGVVAVVLSLLAVPLLVKGHYYLLVFSAQAFLTLMFIPGAPPLWLMASVVGFLFAIVNRCIDSERRLLVGGQIPWAILCLGLVVAGTAALTGGAGLSVLGSARYGGKYYVFILGGILAYFVLAANRMPASRGMVITAVYFLSGVTSLLGILLAVAGPRIPLVGYFVMPAWVMGSAAGPADSFGPVVSRLGPLSGAATAVCLFMLLRYGARGILDVTRPWRGAVFLLSMYAGLYSGFRSTLLFIALAFVIQFLLEGLHRTRLVLAVMIVAALGAAGLAAFPTRLPMPAQRALSFLPFDFSPIAKVDAQESLAWRLDMWKYALDDVPRHLLKGRGYTIDPAALAMAFQSESRGFAERWRWATVTGEFHNGPLSILIPFGLWGAAALAWFLIAVGRMLYRNCVQGDPTLRTVNRMLFGYFLTKVIFFVLLVGTFYLDLAGFCILAGLAVSLNRETSEGTIKQEIASAEAELELARSREPA
jgi:hypothetical protein